MPFRRRWLLLLLPLALLAAGFAALAVPLPDPLAALDARASILITDRHGRPLYEAIDADGNKFVPLPLSAVPLACRHATIATEDSHFYDHPGVDAVAIARAAWQNLRGGTIVSGGSTLTQQLARTVYMTEAERTERSLPRKLREALLALRLEFRYPKDDILALYLNTTYYGHYAVGIEAAAQAYFGLHAAELSLAQCALLAGLPQYPAGYNPIENLQAARARQATVLALMRREGMIDETQARLAGEEGLRFASTPFPIDAPHFVMWVQGRVESLVPQDALRGGGLRVTTTLDLDWQGQAEEAVLRRLAQLRPCEGAGGGTPGVTCDGDADPGRRVENASLVALDPHTGEVLALVGSPDYFDPAISGAVNAALTSRQPGSAIKPLTYAAALDPGRSAAAGRRPWTPATLVGDIRTSFATAEGTPYVPNNYDRRYHGPVTVRTALANSYNIPAVKALDFVGVDALVGLAGDLGIPWGEGSRWRTPEGETAGEALPRYGLALTLGGGEVTLLDLTAAYAAFANGGSAVTPVTILRVETLDGQVLYEHEAETPRPVLDPRVAFLITDILSDTAAREPAFGRNSMLDTGRPAAAKTGTTTDWRDNWTVGYTPGLVTGVWVGNADNSPMKDVSGISGAAPVWHDFMVSVLKDAPEWEFAVPEGVNAVEVCADSGLPPALATPAQLASAGQGGLGEQGAVAACPLRRQEWFIEGTEPQERDADHVLYVLDSRTGRPATAVTPVEQRRPETYWRLPAEYQAWARETNFPQPPAEAGAGSATRGGDGASADGQAALALVSPDANRSFRLDPALPAASQQIPVTVLPAQPDPVTLLVDGRPLAVVTGPDYTAWWPLSKGRHVVAARQALPGGVVVESADHVIYVE